MQSLWMLVSSLLFALMAACVKLASAQYGRPVAWLLAGCVFVGSGGVVLILRPSFGAGQELPALIGLFSGLLSALAYLHVRHLGRIGEPEWRTVFYFSLCGTVVGLVGSLANGLTRDHSFAGIALLLAVGGFATLAQLTMTRAYGKGRTVLTANLQFTAIVFAALLGLVLFGDRVALTGWVGIVTIMASCIAATALVARQAPSPILERSAATPAK